MITLIQDTLALWRDAERVLDRLPPSSPDHETVARLVVELEATYTRLTTASGTSEADLEASRASIERARALLRGVATKRASGAVETSAAPT